MVMRVAIAGAGSIGVGFAIVFAAAGHDVRVWDPYPDALSRARHDLLDRLGKLAQYKLLAEPSAVIAARVEWLDDLPACLANAMLVQECIPERLDLKREFFARAAALAPANCIFASATSAIQPSLIAEGEGFSERLLVAHPGNPPYLLRVIELVPSCVTSSETVERAREFYTDAGLRTVLVRRELEGFVFNRLQGAVLREAYCLVRDGIVDVDEVDAVVREALGLRWSVVGPFETVDLNMRGGISSHAEKMGPAYLRMGQERGQDDPWTADLVDKVAKQRRALLSIEAWEDRVIWRDEQLMRRIRSARAGKA